MIVLRINEISIEHVCLAKIARLNFIVLEIQLKQSIAQAMFTSALVLVMAQLEHSNGHAYLGAILIQVMSVKISRMNHAVKFVLSGQHGLNGLIFSHHVLADLLICRSVFESANVN